MSGDPRGIYVVIKGLQETMLVCFMEWKIACWCCCSDSDEERRQQAPEAEEASEEEDEFERMFAGAKGRRRRAPLAEVKPPKQL